MVSLCQEPLARCWLDVYLHVGVFSHPGLESSGSLPGSVLQGEIKCLILQASSTVVWADIVGLSVPFPLSHSWPEWEFACGRSIASTRG